MALSRSDHMKVRSAQANGARTLDDIERMTDIELDSEEKKSEIEALLVIACKCKKVTINQVLKAIEEGADSVEAIMEATKAGKACGRCKGILGDCLENRR